MGVLWSYDSANDDIIVLQPGGSDPTNIVLGAANLVTQGNIKYYGSISDANPKVSLGEISATGALEVGAGGASALALSLSYASTTAWRMGTGEALRYYGTTSGYVEQTAGSIVTSYTYTLPTAVASRAGDCVAATTNASGVTSFASPFNANNAFIETDDSLSSDSITTSEVTLTGVSITVTVGTGETWVVHLSAWGTYVAASASNSVSTFSIREASTNIFSTDCWSAGTSQDNNWALGGHRTITSTKTYILRGLRVSASTNGDNPERGMTIFAYRTV